MSTKVKICGFINLLKKNLKLSLNIIFTCTDINYTFLFIYENKKKLNVNLDNMIYKEIKLNSN